MISAIVLNDNFSSIQAIVDENGGVVEYRDNLSDNECWQMLDAHPEWSLVELIC